MHAVDCTPLHRRFYMAARGNLFEVFFLHPKHLETNEIVMERHVCLEKIGRI